MKALFFYLFYGFVWLITWLPLKALFLFSDLFFVLLFYIVRYRRKIVVENLKNSFPEKSKKEISRIERKFYKHLCDYFFETIKQLHISDKTMQKHCRFADLDVIHQAYKDGRNVIIYLGHYGNWEWLTSMVMYLDHSGISIYHKLHNPYFDKFFYKLRTRFNATIVPMNETLRVLVKLRQEGKLTITGFIADQVPPNSVNRHWVTFLNQETAVLTGPEKIAIKLDAVVVFFKMKKVKRGYYETEVIPMFDKPKEAKEFEITDRFIEELSKQIIEAPEYWLWSHRRWKRKRPVETN